MGDPAPAGPAVAAAKLEGGAATIPATNPVGAAFDAIVGLATELVGSASSTPAAAAGETGGADPCIAGDPPIAQERPRTIRWRSRNTAATTFPPSTSTTTWAENA